MKSVLRVSQQERFDIEDKLKALGNLESKDKRYAWIRSDLSFEVTTGWQRFLWRIIPRFLKEWVFGVNTKKSQEVLDRLRERVKNDYPHLTDSYNKAASVFSRILKPKMPVILLPPPAIRIEVQPQKKNKTVKFDEKIVVIPDKVPTVSLPRSILNPGTPPKTSPPPPPPGTLVSPGTSRTRSNTVWVDSRINLPVESILHGVLEVDPRKAGLHIDRCTRSRAHRITGGRPPPPPRSISVFTDSGKEVLVAVLEGKSCSAIAQMALEKLPEYMIRELEYMPSKPVLFERTLSTFRLLPELQGSGVSGVITYIDKATGHFTQLTLGDSVEAKFYRIDPENKDSLIRIPPRSTDSEKATFMLLGTKSVWSSIGDEKEPEFIEKCLKPNWKKKRGASQAIIEAAQAHTEDTKGMTAFFVQLMHK